MYALIAEDAPLVPRSMREAAAALCRAAFPGPAPDAAAGAAGAVAAFKVHNATGPRLAACLLQLRTQVPPSVANSGNVCVPRCSEP